MLEIASLEVDSSWLHLCTVILVLLQPVGTAGCHRLAQIILAEILNSFQLQVMASYLQVEGNESELGKEVLEVRSSFWKYFSFGLCGLGGCLLLVSLSLWTSKTSTPQTIHHQPSKPALEVAKDMGAFEFLDLFLDVENVQTAIHHGSFNSSNGMISSAAVKRQLQDLANPATALSIASCTVDSYLVASLIGILGNIINGAVNACKRADKTRTVFTVDIFKDLLPNVNSIIRPDQKIELQDLLDQGCRIGIETTVSIVAFISGFLARAVTDCAMTIKPVPNAGASCASDMSLLTAGIAFLTAGAETAQAVCPPLPDSKDFNIDAEALDIVGGLTRRLRDKRNPLVETKVDDVKEILISRLPALGPIASTLLDNRKFFKLRRQSKKNQARTDKLVKCGFDSAGVVGFSAAVGVFITAGTLECPVAVGDSAAAQGLKMGCSLDISAVIAALTSIAGFIGILATECPEDPKTPAKNLCVTSGFNLVSSLGFISAALSDVGRSCAAL